MTKLNKLKQIFILKERISQSQTPSEGKKNCRKKFKNFPQKIENVFNIQRQQIKLVFKVYQASMTLNFPLYKQKINRKMFCGNQQLLQKQFHGSINCEKNIHIDFTLEKKKSEEQFFTLFIEIGQSEEGDKIRKTYLPKNPEYKMRLFENHEHHVLNEIMKLRQKIYAECIEKDLLKIKIYEPQGQKDSKLIKTIYENLIMMFASFTQDLKKKKKKLYLYMYKWNFTHRQWMSQANFAISKKIPKDDLVQNTMTKIQSYVKRQSPVKK